MRTQYSHIVFKLYIYISLCAVAVCVVCAIRSFSFISRLFLHFFIIVVVFLFLLLRVSLFHLIIFLLFICSIFCITYIHLSAVVICRAIFHSNCFSILLFLALCRKSHSNNVEEELFTVAFALLNCERVLTRNGICCILSFCVYSLISPISIRL